MKSKEGTVDQIRESLDNISNLSDDDLDALENSVVSEFKTVQSQDPTREVVTNMIQLADAADAIRSEREKRTAESAELAQAAADAVARMTGDTDSDGDGDVDPEGNGQPDTDDSADADNADDAEDAAAEGAASDTPDDAEPDAAVAVAVPEPDDTETAAKAVAVADPTDTEDDAAPAATSDDAPAPAADPTADAPAADAAPADAPSDSDDSADDNAPAAEGSDDTDSADAEPELTDEDKQKIASLAAAEDPTVENQPTESEAGTQAVAEENEAAAATPTTADAPDASDENQKETETPVTASATTPEELDFQAPADLAPTTARISAPVTITAGADIKGVPMGSELPDIKAVASALLERKKAMGRTTGGDGEQALVASFKTDFPEARFLNSSDFEGNRAKIDGVVSAEAITAAGGLTAPVETSYDIFELGETLDRPVKDALAVFGADRGGIRFMTPPLLTDLDGAVSLWTLQDDIDASTPGAPDPVKPCLRVAAGTEVVVYVDAIPLCLTFGNLGARAFPELVERHTKLGMVWHARYAETRLLTAIGNLSTPVTAAAELGLARDIFGQLDRAAAAYRSRYRLDENAPLRVIFPTWFKNALRADLIKQLPGDGREGTFNLAEAEINSWFATRSINVSWHIDGETGQIFGSQEAGAALLAFPTTVIWYLFSEGTFLFLDAGTLDLGLVRDSTLNGTNDYKIFLETFEGVAKVGVESLRVTSTLALRGSSAATTVLP
jgi:hypothetical protein